jgi:hypothetical protein
MGVAKVYPDEQVDRWCVARVGGKAWRPFIPTKKLKAGGGGVVAFVHERWE